MRRPLNTHFVLLPQMRLVAFHLEQKQKSFSRFLNIFVGTKCRILVPKKIIVNNCRFNCRELSLNNNPLKRAILLVKIQRTRKASASGGNLLRSTKEEAQHKRGK